MVLLSLLTKMVVGKLTMAGIAKVLTGALAGEIASSMTSYILTSYGLSKLGTFVASNAVGGLCEYSVEKILEENNIPLRNNILGEIPINNYNLPNVINNYDTPLIFGELNRNINGFGPYNYNFKYPNYEFKHDYEFNFKYQYEGGK